MDWDQIAMRAVTLLLIIATVTKITDSRISSNRITIILSSEIITLDSVRIRGLEVAWCLLLQREFKLNSPLTKIHLQALDSLYTHNFDPNIGLKSRILIHICKDSLISAITRVLIRDFNKDCLSNNTHNHRCLAQYLCRIYSKILEHLNYCDHNILPIPSFRILHNMVKLTNLMIL